MMKCNCPIPKCDETGKLILRFMVGGLMLFHGVSKLMSGIDPIAGMLGGAGLPGFVAYGVYIGEIVAPLMLLVGFRARAGALIVAFNMLVALGLAHRSQLFSLSPMGGYSLELQAFYLFGAVAIFFLGAGGFALSKSSSWD